MIYPLFLVLGFVVARGLSTASARTTISGGKGLSADDVVAAQRRAQLESARARALYEKWNRTRIAHGSR
jgi:hypothetical protein